LEICPKRKNGAVVVIMEKKIRLDLFFRLTVSSLGQIPDQESPLELGDIMPLDKKSYDKMRPPKFKGKNFF